MPAFRGLYDGSVEIGQAREARAVQQQMQARQIAAQIAMQTQQLQAQSAQRDADRAASVQQSNADRALKQQQIQANTAIAGQELDLKKQQLSTNSSLAERELGLKQQEFDSGETLRKQKEEQARLMLTHAQQEFDDDQVQRAAQTAFRQSAFGTGILSAMLNGVVAPATLSKINAANGIANNQPGAIIAMGGGPDGAWYDVLADNGKGGLAKMRQEVGPMALLSIAHSVLGEKGAGEWAQMYRTRDSNNTRVRLAVDAYRKQLDMRAMKEKLAAEKFDPALDKARAEEQTRLEGVAATPTTLRDDAETARKTAQKIAGIRAKALKIEDTPAEPAAGTPAAETPAATSKPDDAKGTTPVKSPANSSSIIMGNGVIIINGTPYPDTPKTREVLRKRGITFK